MTSDLTRRRAEALDAHDDLASFRDRFEIPDGIVYLDGNSLGPPSKDVRAAVDALHDEWAARLVHGWDRWLDVPFDVGDRLGAAVLGAAPGQVVVCDSTTVNLFKVLDAALVYQRGLGRDVVVAEDEGFPTDRYVVAELARRHGAEVRWYGGDATAAGIAGSLDGRVAAVVLSAVDYRSAFAVDVAEVTRAAHAHGALVVWDLCHAAGAVPLALDAWNVDLAVGCTYKYLNAGPGAPAYLYVTTRVQPQLTSPIPGWFGADEQFTMAHDYHPRAGVGRFLAGTPNIAATVAVDAAVTTYAAAGMDRVVAKSRALTAYAVELFDARLGATGLVLGTTRDATARGSHLAVRHDEAARLCDDLATRFGIVTDHRRPDVVRLGFAPLYARFTDVWDAVDALAVLMAEA